MNHKLAQSSRTLVTVNNNTCITPSSPPSSPMPHPSPIPSMPRPHLFLPCHTLTCHAPHLFLPCHTNSLLMWLNSLIEKSAARDACLPSFPTIPTPTLAAWIMLTSLPPSPMAATGFLVCILSSCTMRALCVGEQRQHTTAGL